MKHIKDRIVLLIGMAAIIFFVVVAALCLVSNETKAEIFELVGNPADKLTEYGEKIMVSSSDDILPPAPIGVKYEEAEEGILISGWDGSWQVWSDEGLVMENDTAVGESVFMGIIIFMIAFVPASLVAFLLPNEKVRSIFYLD